MVNVKIGDEQRMGEQGLQVVSHDAVDDNIVGKLEAVGTTNGEQGGIIEFLNAHADEIIDG